MDDREDRSPAKFGWSGEYVEPLTHRELDVLQRMAAGESNREIAQMLRMNIKTVESHLHNIYGKLNVRSRTQALLEAQQLGLIVPFEGGDPPQPLDPHRTQAA